MQWLRTEVPPLPYDAAGFGPPVFFIHGQLQDGSFWAPVAGALSSRYRTVCCHMRGRGRSPSPPAPARTDHVSDLLALMDWLGVPSAHLVSHGGGWAAAAGLAVRAPHRVRTLTAVDPVVPRTERPAAIQEAWHLEMLLQWLSVAHGSVVRKPEHVATLQAVIGQQTHVRMDPDPHEAVAATGNPLLEGEMPRLGLVRCPMLIVLGASVTEESKALVASLFGQVRSARTISVPGAVRHTPKEAPHAVSGLLDDFFRDPSL